ncbi:MAG TPA: PepSY-associated TM helix domain-containing protein [Lacunisphaera sp.]|jgi:uncharacterized iron-regulated membrane protein|nr:PepSY domain-containing protein [Lacunisphaera sp.]HQY05526.1 PepSY-associated TM helix domain-containing protein [Lacunisphaera sp.]
MKTFRQILFWSHLVAGLIAGLSIGVMCFTGTLLAFEHEIVEWAERDARRVTPPAADAARLPLGELQRKLREAQPEFRAASITVENDPVAAITFTAGRDDSFFVDPYTGEARKPASTKMHDFMHLMVDWHRYLALAGDNRPTGKLINGICNLAFFGLAVTGLYLWMPRTWSWRGVKAIALFNFKSTGKARDFNWHNVIGLWSAPILIVLTLTAVPISFRWGGNLIYTLVGEEVPAQPGPGAAPSAAPAVEIKRPSPDARPLGYDVVVANVQKDFPKWTQITLRSGGLQRGGPRGGNAATSPTAATPAATPPAAATEPRRERGSGESRAAPQPLTVIIREAGSWPRTATTTLTLNPFTGETLTKAGYADLSTARQVRSWTRFLHTGQALGWGGQFVAGLACLGGCFLVYTGFALSWRRFFPNRKSVPEPIPAS